MSDRLDIVILGLSITSSWGNGHATTFRGLVRHLMELGHRVHFLERNVSWYAENRDMPSPPWGETILYDSLEELEEMHGHLLREADAVVIGSYVPDGIAVGEWVLDHAAGIVAFYDIDTPVTLAQVEAGMCDYLNESLISRYHLYLSFTGGPVLNLLEHRYGTPAARPLYCSVDPDAYYPEEAEERWLLGYMGTYSTDRQPVVDRLLLEPAEVLRTNRFVVAGPQYPDSMRWPDNVDRIQHIPPDEHRMFYNRQRFTLNVTRADMVRMGYAPSVRLFEAAACGVPIISDAWEGLDEFFEPGAEILIAHHGDEVVRYLRTLSPEEGREIGLRARQRALRHHTSRHRAEELVSYLIEAMDARAGQMVQVR